jgi:hypothetical protein
MSVIDTLRPTVTAEDNSGSGYVLDDAYAFDQNVATFSRVIAENLAQFASQILSGFPADTYPTGRSSVVLELDLARFGWTANDRAAVFFRAAHADAWIPVAVYAVADLGTVLTAKTVDITAHAGSAPATGFEVAVEFLNDTAGDPPLPAQ